MDLKNIYISDNIFRPYTLLLFLTIAILVSPIIKGADEKAEMNVLFHIGRSDIDSCLERNRQTIGDIRRFVHKAACDSDIVINDIEIYGFASPEGPVRLNEKLAQNRMQAIENIIFDKNDSINFTSIHRKAAIFDLSALRQEIIMSDIDGRDIALGIISDSTAQRNPAMLIRQLKTTRSGRLWNEIKPLLCNLRYGRVVFRFTHKASGICHPADTAAIIKDIEQTDGTDSISEPVISPLPQKVADEDTIISPVRTRKPFYVSLKTNMLYDAMLIPSIGAEVYLGRMMSVNANWSYAWWSKNSRHNYWRYYGGDIALRRWFGQKAVEKPLTGHHIGLYAQILTYDFELGGKGYMGNKYNYGGGVEYGFSLPIGSRINIDFTLGIGYIGGRYYEYIPLDGHYVWQSTRQRHWFGPTKAEISLVWLIGPGNSNRKKGGGL